MEILGSLHHFVGYESSLHECSDTSSQPSTSSELSSERLAEITANPFLSLNQYPISQTSMVLLAIALICTAPLPSQALSCHALRLGASNQDVVYVQNRLRDLGFFNANSTGYFGLITQDAVFRFQQANNLLADGIVGPQTLRVLNGESITPIAQPAVHYYHAANPSSINPPAINPMVVPVSNAFVINPTVVTPATMGPETSVTLVTTPSSISVPSSSISTGNIGTELYTGSQGASVSQLQTLLKQAGFYPGPITGYYGGLTTVAVQEFQRSKGLPATGITGVKTIEMLRETVD